jgi:hypothetical protein
MRSIGSCLWQARVFLRRIHSTEAGLSNEEPGGREFRERLFRSAEGGPGPA